MIRAEGAAIPVGAQASGSPPRASDAPFERGDHLRGHYFCEQGRTDLTLVIEDVDGDEVAALFEFDYPGGGDGSPVVGSFRMHGAFDARSRSLRLDGDRWVEQPEGYVMVGLVGTVSATGAVTGTVKGPGCTSFHVEGTKRGEGTRRGKARRRGAAPGFGLDPARY